MWDVQENYRLKNFKMPCQKTSNKNGGRRSTILIDQAVPFKSQYLAGFQAEKRDIEYEAIKNTSNKNYKIIRNHCYGTLLLVILR